MHTEIFTDDVIRGLGFQGKTECGEADGVRRWAGRGRVWKVGVASLEPPLAQGKPLPADTGGLQTQFSCRSPRSRPRARCGSQCGRLVGPLSLPRFFLGWSGACCHRGDLRARPQQALMLAQSGESLSSYVSIFLPVSGIPGLLRSQTRSLPSHCPYSPLSPRFFSL